ncbi:RING1 protein and YY1-binding protein-like [Scleropages formosus]|uniref:RING1 protein and YY1-binding protein-like n=1 Tax=Scleropages formosus TaxID=113540 RepID=A0A0P7U5M3_SCLFO|nr:RING1 protein and YY1-binding protein-like [Scleropages formosus]
MCSQLPHLMWHDQLWTVRAESECAGSSILPLSFKEKLPELSINPKTLAIAPLAVTKLYLALLCSAAHGHVLLPCPSLSPSGSPRKPRINSQLVAQQVAQQYATPPPAKKEKKERPERDRHDPDRPDRVLPDEDVTDQVRSDAERPDGIRSDADRQDKERPEKDKTEAERFDKEKPDREKDITPTKKNSSKKTKAKSSIHQSPPSERHSIRSGNSTKSSSTRISRPKLKNVDRSTAQQLAVTVGNVTVIITDFKEKTRSSSTSSSTATSGTGSEQQHQSSGSSRASTPKGHLSAGHDESF